MSVSPDRDLVVRALRRDVDAVDELVRRLGCVGRFLAVRNSRLGAPLRANELTDVAHDVVVKVWESLPEFRGAAALETWVFRFCEFGLLSALRRRRRAGQPILDDVAQPARDMGLEHGELDRVYRALGRLAETEAEVVRRRHFDEESFDAIAGRLGQPVTTVKSRYYRALEKLRIWLEPAREETSG
jgi:RNA polymerase sigma-70 factor (ECF subfamily)